MEEEEKRNLVGGDTEGEREGARERKFDIHEAF